MLYVYKVKSEDVLYSLTKGIWIGNSNVRKMLI